VSEQAKNFVNRRYRVNTWEGHSCLYLGCKCQEISWEGRLLLRLTDRRRCFANNQPLTTVTATLKDRLVMSRPQQQQ